MAPNTSNDFLANITPSLPTGARGWFSFLFFEFHPSVNYKGTLLSQGTSSQFLRIYLNFSLFIIAITLFCWILGTVGLIFLPSELQNQNLISVSYMDRLVLLLENSFPYLLVGLGLGLLMGLVLVNFSYLIGGLRVGFVLGMTFGLALGFVANLATGVALSLVLGGIVGTVFGMMVGPNTSPAIYSVLACIGMGILIFFDTKGIMNPVLVVVLMIMTSLSFYLSSRRLYSYPFYIFRRYLGTLLDKNPYIKNGHLFFTIPKLDEILKKQAKEKYWDAFQFVEFLRLYRPFQKQLSVDIFYTAKAQLMKTHPLEYLAVSPLISYSPKYKLKLPSTQWKGAYNVVRLKLLAYQQQKNLSIQFKTLQEFIGALIDFKRINDQEANPREWSTDFSEAINTWIASAKEELQRLEKQKLDLDRYFTKSALDMSLFPLKEEGLQDLALYKDTRWYPYTPSEGWFKQRTNTGKQLVKYLQHNKLDLEIKTIRDVLKALIEFKKINDGEQKSWTILYDKAIRTWIMAGKDTQKKLESQEIEILDFYKKNASRMYNLPLEPTGLPDLSSQNIPRISYYIPSSEWQTRYNLLKVSLVGYREQSNIKLRVQRFKKFQSDLDAFERVNGLEEDRQNWKLKYTEAIREWVDEAKIEWDQLKLSSEGAEPIVPNLYRYGRCLNPEDNSGIFKGRDDLIDELNFSINSDDQMPTLFFQGQRRVGKSSLLKFLQQRLKAGFRVIEMDLQSGDARSIPIWLGAIRRSVNDTFYITEDTKWEASGDWVESWKELEAYLKLVCREKQTKLVLAFDEYEELHRQALKMHGDKAHSFLGVLRSSSQSKSDITFLFIGQYFFDELKSDDGNWNLGDFFVDAKTILVDYLKKDATIELVVMPLQLPNCKLTYEKGIPEKIYELTKGQPQLVQYICAELINIANRELRTSLGFEDLETVTKKLIEGKNAVFTIFWNHFAKNTKKSRSIISAIHQQKKMPTGTGDYLGYLKQYGYIVKISSNKYKFRFPLLAGWVAENIDELDY